MKVNNKLRKIVLTCCLTAFGLYYATSASAAEFPVAIVNMQEVIARSNAGLRAQEMVKEKIKELELTLERENKELKELEEEIQKKSSAWSEEKKEEKTIEYQRRRRDLRVKKDDANLEVKRMRDQQLEPILKDLEQVVGEVAKKNGYKLVLPRSTVLFVDDAIDVSGEVIKALNAKDKK